MQFTLQIPRNLKSPGGSNVFSHWVLGDSLSLSAVLSSHNLFHATYVRVDVTFYYYSHLLEGT